jgi:hypothetical protein
MSLKALLAQYLTAYESVAQIMLSAIAVDARCMTPAYANIVQHGSLFHELHVERQFRVLPANAQAAVGHLSAVYQEYFPEFIILRVILVYYLLVVHS